MRPAGPSWTRPRWRAHSGRGGSPAPGSTSSRRSRGSTPTCSRFRTSCSPPTSRAPRATRASRWPPWPSATVWPSSRGRPRSPPWPDAAPAVSAETTLQARQPVREGVQHPRRRAGGVGDLERLRDDRARRGEVAPAVLVELRDLLPGLPIEGVVGPGGLPERARRVPARGPLLPARQTQAHLVGGGAREVRGERGPVARERALEIHRLPEAAQPREVLGAQVVVRREGAAEPAEERDEREDVVAVVVEDPRQRRGPPGAEEVEVERRDLGARHVVLALEPDDLALERREPAVGAAGREDAAGRPEEVEVE